MKPNWTCLLFTSSIALAGCVAWNPADAPDPTFFVGAFGQDLKNGTFQVESQVLSVPGPSGEPRSSLLFVASDGTAHTTIYVDIKTLEPLGTFIEGGPYAGKMFQHTPAGPVGLEQYPIFLGMKALLSDARTGDKIGYMGMLFSVAEARSNELVLSLPITLDTGEVNRSFRIQGTADLAQIRMTEIRPLLPDGPDNEREIWTHAGAEVPGAWSAPDETAYQRSRAMSFGPDGHVPPDGEGVPYSMRTAVEEARRMNMDVASFFERNPGAVATRAHYDADAAGTPDTVYRHRWSMTVQGGQEQLDLTVAALANAADGASVDGASLVESADIHENELAAPALQDGELLAISGVYDACSDGLARGLVQLDYARYGFAQGLEFGGLPMPGLSIWACGDVVVGPAWDAATGIRLRTLSQE